MPSKPLGRCPTCSRRSAGRCDSCNARAEEARGSARDRGYGRRHEVRFRRVVLARDPVCVWPGCSKPSTHADHYPTSRRDLVAAGLDPDDPRHGRGLCADHHNSETARHQPGGWNRR